MHSLRRNPCAYLLCALAVSAHLSVKADSTFSFYNGGQKKVRAVLQVVNSGFQLSLLDNGSACILPGHVGTAVHVCGAPGPQTTNYFVGFQETDNTCFGFGPGYQTSPQSGTCNSGLTFAGGLDGSGNPVAVSNVTYKSQVEIMNIDSVPHQYQAMVNGQPVGPPVTVPPGGKYNFQAADFSPVTASIQQLNSDGGVVGTWTGNNSTNINSGGSYPSTPTQPGNADPSGAYYGGSTTNINYGAGASTNAAQAIMAGDSALYDAVVKGFNQTHSDLNGLLSKSNSVSVNVSNSVIITNAETWASNSFRFATNASNVQSGKLSSASSAMLGATNAAGGYGNGTLQSAGTHLGDWTMSDGGGGHGTITLGAAYPLELSLEQWDDGTVGAGKTAASWAISLWLFVMNYRVFRAGLFQAAAAPQARTAGESIVGTNVNFASSLIVAGLIVAAVATIPAFVLPQLISAIGSVVGNPFSALTSCAAWQWVGDCLPLSQLFCSVGIHIVFRMAVDGVCAVVMGIIRFLVGL